MNRPVKVLSYQSTRERLHTEVEFSFSDKVGDLEIPGNSFVVIKFWGREQPLPRAPTQMLSLATLGGRRCVPNKHFEPLNGAMQFPERLFNFLVDGVLEPTSSFRLWSGFDGNTGIRLWWAFTAGS